MKEIEEVSSSRLFESSMGIYTGTGTSHSWLWFVEIFEKMGFVNLTFLDENDIKKQEVLTNLQILLLSGGDTFSIAEGMGEEGAENLTKFIRGGGIYFGSCAGAYLPLKSSKYPLNYLNIVPVKISNLSGFLPQTLLNSEKFWTPYGCHYIFHPVREEVRLKISNGYTSGGGSIINAPLYGGPCMKKSDEVTPLAFYDSFTERTVFLVEKDLAQETILGKMAVCFKEMGNGRLYLSGPHLEHPAYPDANQFLIKLLADAIKEKNILGPANPLGRLGQKIQSNLLDYLKKELSNARILSYALDREAVTWLIGKKIYEPEKFRVFIDAVWKRISIFNEVFENCLSDSIQELVTLAVEIKERLKRLRLEVQYSIDSTRLVEEIIWRLRKFTSGFMKIYFEVKRRKIKGG